jgi:hypothetical protein
VESAETHIVLDMAKDRLNAWRRKSSNLKLIWMRRLPFALAHSLLSGQSWQVWHA